MKRMIFLISVHALVFVQTVAGQTKLDAYVQQSLSKNESINQQAFLLEKNLYALKEAKSLFLPNISFHTSYTLAGGGRTVDIPVGDLVNPVYKTLNQLTSGNNFTQVENQSILLNPNNFYDAKIHITYPIINAELVYNKKIKSQQYDMQKLEINVYKRELVKEVKTAYYKFLQAAEDSKVCENAMLLVNENARINTALFDNQKVNRTAVLRSNNEVLKITAQLNTAKQEEKNAKAYFNFLLNKPLTDSIEVDGIQSIPDAIIINDTSVSKKEELLKLNKALSINKNAIALAATYKIPKLNSFLDVGSQGFDFAVNNKTPYYFFGLSLDFNIFSGNANKYRVKQAEADAGIILSQTKYAEQQLHLQLTIAINAFTAAIINYQAAVSRVNASEKYYNDILKLYKQSTAPFIELLDAQNQLIAAQLQVNISLFDTLIKQAEIERGNASFIIQ